MNKNKVYLVLLTATLLWGIQPLCVKIIVAQWTPESLTVFRYVFISLILFLVMYFRGEGNIFPPKKLYPMLMLMGLMGIAFNNVLQFTGLKMSSITNATLISATGPAVTAFLAWIFIKERLSISQWLGILISFAGVMLLLTKGSWEILAKFAFNFGDILFLLCQIVWAGYSLLGLKVMKYISAIKATAWAGLFGAIEVYIYGTLTQRVEFFPLTQEGIISMLFVIFLGGSVAMLFWNIGVQQVGPAMAAIFANFTPVFGMLVGYVALSEPIGFLQIGGAVIIFGGVFITTQQDLIKSFLEGKKGFYK